MKPTTCFGLLIVVIALAAAALAPLADATPCDQEATHLFGIEEGCFDGSVDSDPLGNPFTQAGGHPYAAATAIDFNMRPNPDVASPPGFPAGGWPAEPVKDVFVDLPAGLIGDPTSLDQCTIGELAGDPITNNSPLCPAGSQVGRIALRLNYGLPFPLANDAVYNMVPPPGVPARFGIQAFGTIVVLDAVLRRSGGEYRVAVNSRNISEGLSLTGTTLTLWGVPADPSHDAQRYCPGQSVGCASQAALKPFLRLPTACTPIGQGLPTTLRTDSWANPGVYDTAGFESHLPPGRLASSLFPAQPDPAFWGANVGPTSCAEVPFSPVMDVQPTVHAADSPTGLSVDLSLPQSDNPETIATSDLKRAVVTLPSGMTVNPAAANGLASCGSAQIALETTEPPSCPDASKIGTLAIDTPLLDHRVDGSVYLAAQADNPFGSLLAIYIVAEDPGSGVVLKLPGRIETGPGGQLTTTFDDQPQLPFSGLHLELFGGPRAALRTPSTCGTKTTEAGLSPWARPDLPVTVASFFQITSGPGGTPCPEDRRSFNPRLSAGTESNSAGTFSPLHLGIERADGTQELSGISLALPEGLTGKLAGISYCPQAVIDSIPTGDASLGLGAGQQASPTCPAASRLGTVTVGAGAGLDPFYLDTGRVYLAGPYKGAPLSLAVVTPVLAGPFDLGNVVVRTALRVDPDSARIDAVSDPLPTSLQGIPLDLRDVRVDLTRPGFTLNPTGCNPRAVAGTVAGSEGARAAVSTRFQAADCAALPFKPKLAFKLSGATKRGGHPALRAVLKMPKKSGTNIARTSVALPHSEFLAQDHIKTICTRVQYAADQCPNSSIYGHARALTPLLDASLRGPVYLRSSSHQLPDLVVALHGQIDVDLIGHIDTDGKGGIRTTFASVPDAPVSKFVLAMAGGKKGLLENSRNLCRTTNRATVLMDGQNGKVSDSRPLVQAQCGRKRSGG